MSLKSNLFQQYTYRICIHGTCALNITYLYDINSNKLQWFVLFINCVSYFEDKFMLNGNAEWILHYAMFLSVLWNAIFFQFPSAKTVSTWMQVKREWKSFVGFQLKLLGKLLLVVFFHIPILVIKVQYIPSTKVRENSKIIPKISSIWFLITFEICLLIQMQTSKCYVAKNRADLWDIWVLLT